MKHYSEKQQLQQQYSVSPQNKKYHKKENVDNVDKFKWELGTWSFDEFCVMGCLCPAVGASLAVRNIYRKTNTPESVNVYIVVFLLVLFGYFSLYGFVWMLLLYKFIIARMMEVQCCNLREFLPECFCVMLCQPCYLATLFRAVGTWSDGNAIGQPIMLVLKAGTKEAGSGGIHGSHSSGGGGGVKKRSYYYEGSRK